MDISEISETDRELILKFANAMRDLDVLTILAKPGRPVSESEKQKISKKFDKDADRPIQESFLALTELEQSSNSDLRNLAKHAIEKQIPAVAELRRIGKRLKQE